MGMVGNLGNQSIQVVQAGDHGLPLAESAPKSPLRKEIAKLAKSVHDVNQSAETAAK